MLLAQFFTDIYTPIRLINGSKRTFQLYDYTIRKFSEHLERPAQLSDLNDLTVSRHLKAMMESGMSPHSVKKEQAQLRAIWNLAAKRRMVENFPQLPAIKAPDPIPVAWTMHELAILLRACERKSGSYRGVDASEWWSTLVLVLWETGERINAALNAQWCHLTAEIITFPAENRKGRQWSNVCQLSKETTKRVNAIKNPRRKLIWCWPYSDTYLYHVFNRILDNAGLPCDARSKFHRIRRSHATHLKINGGDPTTSLCHSNPATTARYLDPRLIPKGCDKLPKIG